MGKLSEVTHKDPTSAEFVSLFEYNSILRIEAELGLPVAIATAVENTVKCLYLYGVTQDEGLKACHKAVVFKLLGYLKLKTPDNAAVRGLDDAIRFLNIR